MTDKDSDGRSKARKSAIDTVSDAELDAALLVASGVTAAVLLPTSQAAARLALRPCTLEKWRSTGGGPRYIKMGRSVRYRAADLDAFALERLCSHTAQY